MPRGSIRRRRAVAARPASTIALGRTATRRPPQVGTRGSIVPAQATRGRARSHRTAPCRLADRMRSTGRSRARWRAGDLRSRRERTRSDTETAANLGAELGHVAMIRRRSSDGGRWAWARAAASNRLTTPQQRRSPAWPRPAVGRGSSRVRGAPRSSPLAPRPPQRAPRPRAGREATASSRCRGCARPGRRLGSRRPRAGAARVGCRGRSSWR